MPTSSTKIHRSPLGKWRTPELTAHAWVSGDNRAKTPVYWWVQIERGNVSKADYEVRWDDEVVIPRTRLVKSPKVFAQTGFVVDDRKPLGDRPIGGAAKLDAGVYDVDFILTTADGVERVLRGVRFEVADRKAEKGGWQILPDRKRGKG